MLNPIKVSVVIPTRERAETLEYTIKTALNQTLQAYEVIVSDNFSQDHTKQVFDSFNDARLKYVNTMQRLSMTDNFNFGVSHATGDYIIIIGDDDGIMPNAIDKFCKVIDTHPSDLYTWPRHGYVWPSNNKGAQLERIAEVSEPVEINIRKQLGQMLQKGLLLNSAMPNTYHSATHRRVYDEIKKETGKYHQTTNPDEFMLFTLPAYREYAVNVGEALTANGHSPKSNSGTTLNKKNKGKNAGLTEIDKFINEQSDYQIHTSIPSGFPKTVSFVLDTFLVTRDLYTEFYKAYKTNYSGMWAYAWTIFNLKNFMEPVRRRKELQQHESFNAAAYLLLKVLFFIYLNIKKVNLKSNKNKHIQDKFLKNSPKNIVEFVNFLNKISVKND
jgi:glycosyltransferase involved in cell wall biosynthesis